MQHKKWLDFIIIGTQKGGTTSLFKYMYLHPKIFMPPEKEAPYFNLDEKLVLGWEWYLKEYFANATDDQTWGKVTPDYMLQQSVAQRIAKVFPDIKLIAVLRDPIERAFSEYRMQVKRQQETRPFNIAMSELLQESKLLASRTNPDPLNSYIIRGEYGRILRWYYELFPKENIFILFTHSLTDSPLASVQQIFKFIGLDHNFVPNNIGEKYHIGGTKQKLPWADKWLNQPAIRSTLRRFLGRSRHKMAYWFAQWNTVAEEDRPNLPYNLHRQLIEHYVEDAQTLEQLICCKPSWLKMYDQVLNQTDY